MRWHFVVLARSCAVNGIGCSSFDVVGVHAGVGCCAGWHRRICIRHRLYSSPSMFVGVCVCRVLVVMTERFKLVSAHINKTKHLRGANHHLTDTLLTLQKRPLSISGNSLAH